MKLKTCRTLQRQGGSLEIRFFSKENLLYSVVKEAENLLVIKDNFRKLLFLFHLANS